MSQKAKEETRRALREKLPQYIEKIQQESVECQKKFLALQEQFIKQAQERITTFFLKARQAFRKSQKPLQKQLTTLKYYDSQPSQQPHLPNLYPLYLQIDQKMLYNFNLIEENHLTMSLPFPSSGDLDFQVIQKKIGLYQGYIQQLEAIVKSQNVRKYCKKESQNAQKVMKTYGRLLQNVKQTVYTSQIKLKKPFEEMLAELSKYKHVQKMHLSIITTKGVIMPKHYHQLIGAIKLNRGFLSQLTLRLMDMEFSQEKCDILRKRINQEFKCLKNIAIHNYYKQCKLGQFQDFNWHPYRKKEYGHDSLKILSDQKRNTFLTAHINTRYKTIKSQHQISKLQSFFGVNTSRMSQENTKDSIHCQEQSLLKPEHRELLVGTLSNMFISQVQKKRFQTKKKYYKFAKQFQQDALNVLQKAFDKFKPKSFPKINREGQIDELPPKDDEKVDKKVEPDMSKTSQTSLNGAKRKTAKRRHNRQPIHARYTKKK